MFFNEKRPTSFKKLKVEELFRTDIFTIKVAKVKKNFTKKLISKNLHF
jgi:hypothetical protein